MALRSVTIYRQLSLVAKFLGFIPETKNKQCLEYFYKILNIVAITICCAFQGWSLWSSVQHKITPPRILILSYRLNEMAFVLSCGISRLIYRNAWVKLLRNLEYVIKILKDSKIYKIEDTLETLVAGIFVIICTFLRIYSMFCLSKTSFNPFTLVRYTIDRCWYFVLFVIICVILDINIAMNKHLTKILKNTINGTGIIRKNEKDILFVISNIRLALGSITLALKYVNKIFAWIMLCIYFETALSILTSLLSAIQDDFSHSKPFFRLLRTLLTVVSI